MAQYKIDNLPAPINFEIGDDMIARTVQNAKNLLMAQMCEVPYDRYRGLDPALFDLPMAKLREKLLPELDRAMLWEPDVEVADADCELDEDGNVIIMVTLEINITE